MHKSNLLAIPGAIILCLVLFAHYKISLQGVYRLATDSELEEVVLTGGPIHFSRIRMFLNEHPGHWPYWEFVFTYPTEIPHNTSEEVFLEYFAGVIAGQNYPVSQSLSEPLTLVEQLTVTLTSSSLSVEDIIASNKQPGTQLPTTFSWTITPQGVGNHFLNLDYGDLMNPFGLQEQPLAEIFINDEPVDPDPSGTMTLPITVYEHLNITERLFAILRNVASLVGIVLVIPGLLNGLRWLRIQARKRIRFA